jgi:tetratricopeptide (TPR) repeat protein
VREAVTEAVLDRHQDVPLLQYRVGICGDPLLLNGIREPDFVDAEFELGRAALARDGSDEEEALEHFRTAHDAFPTSPAILVAMATLLERREDWPGALEAYESAVQLTPTHRDALLGRTISLSRLGRHDEAVMSASTLIGLGSWFVAEAYYWRAWNQYQRGELGPARADVDASKAVSRSPVTLVLSGIIGWRENRLAMADAELSAALEQDFGYCEAALYLGFVRADDRRWADSLAALSHADQCFTLTVATSRNAIAQLSLTDEDARTNARRIASHRRSMADAEERRSTALDRITFVGRQIEPTR